MHKIQLNKSNKIPTKKFFKYRRFCGVYLLELETEVETEIDGREKHDCERR